MESSALRASGTPVCKYKLDTFVTGNRHISSPQLEAIAYCCQQHEMTFGDYRLGFFIGDGTGI